MEKHKHKPIFIIPEYHIEQIKLEKEYYEKLSVSTDLLIIVIINYFAGNIVTLSGLMQLYQTFLDRNMKMIHIINYEYAVKIYKLSENVISTNSFAVISKVDNIAKGMDMRCRNMLNAIVGRFLSIIPAGYSSNGKNLYTNDYSKEALIKRSHYTVNETVRDLISATLTTLLVFNGEVLGYTEYVGQNQHDDKVRLLHRKYFDGETWLRFDNPPPCGHPAHEDNCRCYIVKMR